MAKRCSKAPMPLSTKPRQAGEIAIGCTRPKWLAAKRRMQTDEFMRDRRWRNHMQPNLESGIAPMSETRLLKEG